MDDATRRQVADLVAAWWVVDEQCETELENVQAERKRETTRLLLVRARQRRQEREEQECLERQWLLLLAQHHRRGLLASLPAPALPASAQAPAGPWVCRLNLLLAVLAVQLERERRGPQTDREH